MAEPSDFWIHPPGAYERNRKEDFLLKQGRCVGPLVRPGRANVSQCGSSGGYSGGDNMPRTAREDSVMPDVRTLLGDGEGYSVRGPLSALTAYTQEIRIDQMRDLQWPTDVVDRLTKSITKANEQLSKKDIQKSGRSRRNKVRLLLG